jgi:uncharacterized protein YwqG
VAIDLKQEFAAWREKHARPAWKPACVEGDQPSGAAHGQFGGLPLLGPEETWPRCQSCRAPMQFLLQLPLDTLPMPVRGEGMLQLFYCSQDGVAGCETWEPFSGTQQIRISGNCTVQAQRPKGLEPLPLRVVQGWTEFVDYPHTAEHARLGLQREYVSKRKLFAAPTQKVTISCPELGIVHRDLDIGAPGQIADAQDGDKLGGWPYWAQGIDYPQCPQCMGTMEYVMQIDSEDNVPFMFGDGGCAHISQCPTHPQVLAFAWAC